MWAYLGSDKQNKFLKEELLGQRTLVTLLDGVALLSVEVYAVGCPTIHLQDAFPAPSLHDV